MSNALRAVERAAERAAEKAATITVTVGDLVNSRQVLADLMRQKFPAGKGKQSLTFGRLCRDVFRELETAYDPAYNELLKKFGTESTETPGNFTITADRTAEFQAAVVEVISAEVTLLHQSMPELVDLFPFSAADALALEWLINPEYNEEKNEEKTEGQNETTLQPNNDS